MRPGTERNLYTSLGFHQTTSYKSKCYRMQAYTHLTIALEMIVAVAELLDYIHRIVTKWRLKNENHTKSLRSEYFTVNFCL